VQLVRDCYYGPYTVASGRQLWQQLAGFSEEQQTGATSWLEQAQLFAQQAAL